MCELLASKISSAPGCWTNNKYVGPTNRVNIKEDWLGFGFVLVYDEPALTINDQIIQS